MRVGVIGCGYWGVNHVRTLSGMAGVDEVVAIDGRATVRESIATSFPSVLTLATLTEAIDHIDGAVVATPPESHFDLAAEAISAGKHVLVEKPIATSTKEAAEIVRLAHEAGVVFASGHTFAHNPAVWKLGELIDAGDLGTLHYLDASRLNLGLYREDVNVLWDLAAHDISISYSLLGQIPDVVSAWGARHTEAYAEDVATLRMTFEDAEVESTVRVSWLDPVKVRRTTIVGSDRMAVYDDLASEERIKIYDRGRRPAAGPNDERRPVTYHHGDTRSPLVDFGEPLRHELTDFVRCSQTGATPKADGRAGLAVVATLEASDQSLLENGTPVPVELPDLKPPTNRSLAETTTR